MDQLAPNTQGNGHAYDDMQPDNTRLQTLCTIDLPFHVDTVYDLAEDYDYLVALALIMTINDKEVHP